MRTQYRGTVSVEPATRSPGNNFLNFRPTHQVQPDGSAVELSPNDPLRSYYDEPITLSYDWNAASERKDALCDFIRGCTVDVRLCAEDLERMGNDKYRTVKKLDIDATLAPENNGDDPLLYFQGVDPQEPITWSPDRSPRPLYELIRARREHYPRADVLNMLLCVFQGSLTVFAGAPGGGKTSFCDILAQALGLDKDHYIRVPVQQGWTSKGDLIGYHNPLASDEGDPIVYSNKELYDALKKNTDVDDAARPLLVLLDEANLSPMEYYWADFMAMCDRWEQDDKDVDLGGENNTLPVRSNVRFLATANNDYTTKEFSPRLLDRAWVVTMPEQAETALDADDVRALVSSPAANEGGEALDWTWPRLKSLFVDLPDAAPDAAALDAYNAVKETLAGSFPISHRAEKAVWRYWMTAQPLFEDLGDELQPETPALAALDYALLQRVLPQLQGSGEETAQLLTDLQALCAEQALPRCAKKLEAMLAKGAPLDFYTFFC